MRLDVFSCDPTWQSATAPFEMQKYITYSDLGAFEWPSGLLKQFAAYYTEGIFTFEDGDRKEAFFAEQCIKFQIDSMVSRDEDYAVLRSELPDLQSSFLFIEVHKLNYSGPAIFDLASGCKICRYGMLQKNNLALDPRLANRHDIGRLFVPSAQVWIVSRRAKDILLSAGFGGCEFVPCLRTDRKYSADEILFGANVPRIQSEAEHFQLIWDGKVRVKIGEANITRTCPECGVKTKGPKMLGASSPKIIDTLEADTDFLAFNEYETIAGDKFTLRGTRHAVSGRVLSVMLDHNLKGIDSPYSKQPMIDFRMLPFASSST